MTNNDPDSPENSRYWVRSVARAAELLEVLSGAPARRGMSVTELATALGLSKSSAFSTLQTLSHFGLVADDGEGMNRRYRLGMTLARLGSRARDQLSLVDVARPHLTRLTAEVGFSSRLAVPDSDQAVVVDQVATAEGVQIELRMGFRELPHCTGLGKALLSTMDDAAVSALIARTGLPRRTTKTITDEAALRAHLDDIRGLGYAVDDEEDAEGVFCIGAPLFGAGNTCVGAISITGLKLGQPSWRYAELGRVVRDTAARISVGLGYAADHESR
ncbi:IclR family transcriptional regulator [Kribbella shirazensis]|jgi:IclR family transcriptional regulator, acetate operon repressor|uniref:IclR family acetate operon transcriptional repressor n=1 Tax=Kribbella shirazensis TaxID=1105143 RepID=A0A7X5VCF3_9ACTN|nr:IclR family transcriptional regulator [Kribbella shirazensis]NIK58409.1 IclR family acetate operon transcriptional repressor [Kribbella shirazensis]